MAKPKDSETQKPIRTLVHLVLRGTFPIMFNRMTDEALEALGGSSSSRTQQARPDVPPKRIAEEKLHVRDGTPGVPFEMLFACLVEAGRYVKYAGMKKVTGGDSSLIPSFLTIEGEFFPFQEGATWTVDKRRGKNDKNQALLLIRPRFDEWSLEVDIEIDNAEVPNELVRTLFERAGKAVGLGSFAKKGPFGRFEIAEWKETPVYDE